MLVRAKPEAVVEVKVSDTMKEVDFKFTGASFSLHDDAFVLRQMASNIAAVKAEPQPCSASALLASASS